MRTNRKIYLVLIFTLAVVAALVVGFSSHSAQASIFDSISNFFRAQFGATSTAPIILYKPVIDYEQAVIQAVEKNNPAVVSIIITKDLPVIKQRLHNPFGDLPSEFQEFFGRGFGFEFYEPYQSGTERREIGGGTGFIVSEDGLVVTNKHVVLDEAADYTVLTNDGEKYDAEVLARDPIQDIAVLRINVDGLEPVQFGDSDSIKLGQTAIVIGNALGEFRNTVSVGVISGLARSIIASDGGGFVERIEDVIQTDAAINQGNSGGPLINLKGEVIGMSTAMAQGAQNIGFAIPINKVRRDIESVKQTGSIKISFLGVRYISITPELIEEEDLLVDYGVLVRGNEDGPGIIPGSPAERAGLQAEDIILELGGEEVTLSSSLGSLIHKRQVGDTVTIKVRRGEENIELQATLAERLDL